VSGADDLAVSVVGGHIHRPAKADPGPTSLPRTCPAADKADASIRLAFGIFAALARFERELNSERTLADLASARARGRTGG
jgi:hypothetical protein